MHASTRQAIEALAGDTQSGASELLPRAASVLQAVARDHPEDLEAAALAVANSQPSMASFWNLALSALAESERPGSFDRFLRRVERAPGALARVAVEALAPGAGSRLCLVTCSFSGSVLACLRGLKRAGVTVEVACAEGRPGFEGRRLASTLAAEGIEVEFYSDAAIGDALRSKRDARGERAAVVGADAVAPWWFVNKVGTGQLAAAALHEAVPVFVLATRDKFVDERVSRLVGIEERPPGEIWEEAPRGVVVRNRYFERVPLDLVSSVITDAGVLAGEMIGEACRAAAAGLPDRVIDRLRIEN